MGHGGVAELAGVLAVESRSLKKSLAAAAMLLVGRLAAGQPSEVAAAHAIARRARETMHIDGRLDEPAWHDAARLSGFVQREPMEGSESSEETEVRILFTDTEGALVM